MSSRQDFASLSVEELNKHADVTSRIKKLNQEGNVEEVYVFFFHNEEGAAKFAKDPPVSAEVLYSFAY